MEICFRYQEGAKRLVNSRLTFGVYSKNCLGKGRSKRPVAG